MATEPNFANENSRFRADPDKSLDGDVKFGGCEEGILI
jgi:hypothetical protein